MKQSDILLRSGMWKIQNEKNTTKFEKQTLRFEIKKEKISTLEKLPHIETKNNIFEFTSSNWPVYRSRKREKNWKWKGTKRCIKDTASTFVPSSLLLEDCVHSIVSNNLPSAGSIPLSPFWYDGFRLARRKSRSSRVGDARLIYRSLATYAIACARFVTRSREGGRGFE